MSRARSTHADAVFVSYSHRDRKLVTPVVNLLRAARDLVFQDIDSIRAGRRWSEEIRRAIEGARLVVVFWCEHSSKSGEVQREYELAHDIGKDIVPVLLDRTPVAATLRPFQWVDFQEVVGRAHATLSRGWLHRMVRGVAAVVVLLLAASVSLVSLSSDGGNGNGEPFGVVATGIAILALFAGLALWYSVRRRRARKRKRRMATILGGEIDRRSR